MVDSFIEIVVPDICALLWFAVFYQPRSSFEKQDSNPNIYLESF